MEEALFFRIEDAQGIGPYCTEDLMRPSIQSVCSTHDDYLTMHPGPYSDPLLSAHWVDIVGYQSYVFGFESLEALFAWFCLPEEQAYLVKYKMRVVCYRTQDYIKGEKQMVAKKSRLKLVDYAAF